MEERARQRAEAEQAEYERKVEARAQRKGRAKGKQIKAPEATPGAQEQINLVDADSRLMRKNKRSGYEQCYNAQAVVDAGGSQLVLSARVSSCGSDRNELTANVRAIPASVGQPTAVLADSGYACESRVKELEQRQIEVYVATGAEAREQKRRYDFRPPGRRSEKANEPVAQWLKQMKAKLESESGRALYALRKQTVEPVFGIIKAVLGFRQFLLRGLKKVCGEWTLVALAYNVKRLWVLKAAARA